MGTEEQPRNVAIVVNDQRLARAIEVACPNVRALTYLGPTMGYRFDTIIVACPPESASTLVTNTRLNWIDEAVRTRLKPGGKFLMPGAQP